MWASFFVGLGTEKEVLKWQRGRRLRASHETSMEVGVTLWESQTSLLGKHCGSTHQMFTQLFNFPIFFFFSVWCAQMCFAGKHCGKTSARIVYTRWNRRLFVRNISPRKYWLVLFYWKGLGKHLIRSDNVTHWWRSLQRHINLPVLILL